MQQLCGALGRDSLPRLTHLFLQGCPKLHPPQDAAMLAEMSRGFPQ